MNTIQQNTNRNLNILQISSRKQAIQDNREKNLKHFSQCTMREKETICAIRKVNLVVLRLKESY